jgi:hypothetical protein
MSISVWQLGRMSSDVARAPLLEITNRAVWSAAWGDLKTRKLRFGFKLIRMQV